MFIQVHDLSIKFGKNPILHHISAQFEKGQVTTIIGPNGAGKSTLLKCLAGIYPIQKNKVIINNRDMNSFTLKERAKLIGYVPQLNIPSFPLTVLETVLLGRKPHMGWGVSQKDLHVVQSVMEELDINLLADRYLDELSGGQRQKVSIARALAQESTIMMLDEPTSALDLKYQYEVLGLVRKLADEQGKLIILVLHDLELAARFSDRLLLLKDGKEFQTGVPANVITEANLRNVYGVDTEIFETKQGIKISVIAP